MREHTIALTVKVHWGYVAAPIPPALVGAVDVEESGTKECESGSVGVWQPAKVNPPPHRRRVTWVQV